MADEKSSTPGIGGRILKVIGVVTAVISLILGARQIVNMIQDNTARKNKAAELTAEAKQLAASGLHSKAWETISQAPEAGPGVREAQVDLAMEWLRHVHIPPNQKERTFAEIVNKLAPTLHRALDTTRKQYSATVRAHIGWAAYLLWKEGDRSVKIDEHFRDALQLDSTNLYAHAMYGFWLLYPGHDRGTLNEGNRHFAIALRSGQEKEYVRDLMFSAYRNWQRADYQAQIIRLANEIRKSNEAMDLSERQRIVGDTYSPYSEEVMNEVGKVVTPKEQLATFMYLTEGIDLEGKPYLKKALAHLKRIGAQE